MPENEPTPLTNTVRWWAKKGASVEFFAPTPDEAKKLEALYRDKPDDPSLAGKVRPIGGQVSAPQTSPQQKDIIGRLKEQLVGNENDIGRDLSMAKSVRPGDVATAMRGIGQFALPGSIPEAAVMAALPVAGAAAGMIPGATLAANLARVGTRLGLTTAAGAVSGAASAGSRGETVKEGAIAGAKLGLTAAGLQEVFNATGTAIEKFTEKYGHLDTQVFKARVREVLGPKLGDAIESDIPSLKGKLPRLGNIAELVEEEKGRKVLGTMFDDVEKQISQATKGKMIPVPNEVIDLASSVRGPAAQQATAPGVGRQVQGLEGQQLPLTPMTSDEAIKLGKVLRNKSISTKGPDSRLYRQAADRVLEEVNTSIPKSLATKYESLRQDYSKFMDLRDFLGERTHQLFPGMPQGGPTVDLVEFGNRLVNNLANVDHTRFPKLHEFFTGPGGETGTRPTAGAIPIAGRMRMSEGLPGGIRMYEGSRLGTVKLGPEAQRAIGGQGLAIGQGVKTAGKIAAPLLTPTIESLILQDMR